MKRLKIGQRLGLGFAAIIAMLAVALVVALSGLRTVSASLDETIENEKIQEIAREWLSRTHSNINAVVAIAKSRNDPAVEAHFAPRIAEGSREINRLQERMGQLVESAEGRKLMEEIAAQRQRYLDARVKFFDALKGGVADSATLDDLSAQMIAIAEQYIESIGRMTAFQQAQTQQLSERSDQLVGTITLILLLIAAVSLVAGSATAILISRSVTVPIRDAVEVAQAIAAGDLTRDVRVDRADELGGLQSALADMRTALVRVVQEIRDSSHSISDATGEIAAGNHDLSARTEQQAASLEETAASMEELTATVKQNADNARQASRLAVDASGTAEQGQTVVHQVVATMEEIADSSQRIANIIGVIDSIAFQTNILALNASVEAARAGEQGRGFAVVANEVRTLASRCATAAQEIRGLIEESVSRVQGGSQRVEDAGRIMQQVVTSVRKVSDIIDEIAAASQEQSQGIEQISTAVGQLDQVTQQNSSLVQNAARSSAALAQHADSLEQAVKVFNLGRASTPPSRPRPARTPAPQSARTSATPAYAGGTPTAEWTAF